MTSKPCGATKLFPSEIASELEAIAVLMPIMLEDPSAFPVLFEEQRQKLLNRVAPNDRPGVVESLDALAALATAAATRT